MYRAICFVLVLSCLPSRLTCCRSKNALFPCSGMCALPCLETDRGVSFRLPALLRNGRRAAVRRRRRPERKMLAQNPQLKEPFFVPGSSPRKPTSCTILSDRVCVRVCETSKECSLDATGWCWAKMKMRTDFYCRGNRFPFPKPTSEYPEAAPKNDKTPIG